LKTIFEKSGEVGGIRLTDEAINVDFIAPEFLRDGEVGLPRVSELEVMRHYKELSDRNFCIEKGFYPLGSCTMKYNPKVNELLAGLEGFANLHPFAQDSQGALELMTNPNTLGIFEENVLEISKLMHDNGSLLYYDGANFNAIMGYNIHPPTVFFPLIVPGAMMIEPTETESKARPDEFVEVMLKIKDAPPPANRIDETRAARQADLKYEKN
jgi:glycine cleavage system protein P-like pyridoxal-binding family